MKLLTLSLLIFGCFSLQAKEDSTKKINQFLEKNENVLVHVHADWCPSCKTQKKGEQQKKGPYHPIEFPRWFVRTGQKDPKHMQHHSDHHPMGRPSMHIT